MFRHFSRKQSNTRQAIYLTRENENKNNIFCKTNALEVKSFYVYVCCIMERKPNISIYSNV